MKHFAFLTSAMLFSIIAFSQQIPFQGKLFENGQAVNGQRTFEYSIQDGGVNWTEIHANSNVNNGLYFHYLGSITPLPNNLYNSQSYHDLVVKVNGTIIDTVKIFVPIIPFNWIKSLPPLDTVIGNELQTLSYNPITGELAISNGNNIIISPSLGAFDSLTIGSYDTTSIPTISQTASSTTPSLSSFWQSFQATNDGRLTGIELSFANILSVDVQLKIYNGQGNSSQAIYNNTFPASSFQAILSNQLLPITNTTINLSAGNVYTFEIIPIINNIIVSVSYSDPYFNGISSIGIMADTKFNILQEIVTLPTMEISPSGVSINTDLEVNGGRIKDKTGEVSPVGMIVPFGGTIAPQGWLLCDGSAINREEYQDLFNVIGVNFGPGDNSSTFNIPDIRGRFLRGVSGNSGYDPQTNNRISTNGGNSGNNVGSFQYGSTARPINNFIGLTNSTTSTISIPSHSGTGFFGSLQGYEWNTNLNSNDIFTQQLGLTIPQTSLSITSGGDIETRPINIYVHYIIKY